jgi:hypothetical protein
VTPRHPKRDQPRAKDTRYAVTPDSRYFVVRGRLWRMSNPELSESEEIVTRKI